MKTRVSTAVLLLFLLGSMACRAESDKDYADRRIRESEGRITKVTLQQNTEIAKLQDRVDKLEKSLQAQAETNKQLSAQLESLKKDLDEQMRAQLENLKKDLGEQIQTTDTKAEKVGKRWVIALWVGIPLLVLVSLGICFLFVPSSTRSAIGVRDGGGRPKCPRCGWEHDPADTICKNPACKTQF